MGARARRFTPAALFLVSVSAAIFRDRFSRPRVLSAPLRARLGI
jgi:hypothetical protein